MLPHQIFTHCSLFQKIITLKFTYLSAGELGLPMFFRCRSMTLDLRRAFLSSSSSCCSISNVDGLLTPKTRSQTDTSVQKCWIYMNVKDNTDILYYPETRYQLCTLKEVNLCCLFLILNLQNSLNGIIHLQFLKLSIFISGISRWELEVGQPTVYSQVRLHGCTGWSWLYNDGKD